MERVTFHDSDFVKRVQASCVATWRNAVPGFHTACLDDPRLGGCGGMVSALLLKQAAGLAPQNVATVFSTADGRVLHVAPGAFSPKDLARELDFALAVNAAVAAAPSEDAARLLCAAKHVARAQTVADDVPQATLRSALGFVHESFAKRPLVPLAKLELADYTAARLDTEATLAAGAECERQTDHALARK
jgi:hypothetical protein